MAMKTFVSHTKTQAVCSSLTYNRITRPNDSPQNFMVQMEHKKQTKRGLAMDCAKWDSWVPLAEAERVLKEEEVMDPEVEEWMKAKLRDKCRDRSGVVELLECLEREVIMGEDEGKEPLDYNIRAHIFDKSSRVFQALKERAAPRQS